MGARFSLNTRPAGGVYGCRVRPRTRSFSRRCRDDGSSEPGATSVPGPEDPLSRVGTESRWTKVSSESQVEGLDGGTRDPSMTPRRFPLRGGVPRGRGWTFTGSHVPGDYSSPGAGAAAQSGADRACCGSGPRQTPGMRTRASTPEGSRGRRAEGKGAGAGVASPTPAPPRARGTATPSRGPPSATPSSRPPRRPRGNPPASDTHSVRRRRGAKPGPRASPLDPSVDSRARGLCSSSAHLGSGSSASAGGGDGTDPANAATNTTRARPARPRCPALDGEGRRPRPPSRREGAIERTRRETARRQLQTSAGSLKSHRPSRPVARGLERESVSRRRGGVGRGGRRVSTEAGR